MDKRKKRNSLAFKLVLIVAVFTFPINIFMAYYAKQSQNVIVKDAQMAVSSMAEFYMNDVEHDIQSLNSFFLNLEESDISLSNIIDCREWNDYYISGLGLRESMSSQMTVRGDANCYFFYYPKMDHGMLVENSGHFTQGQLIEHCFQRNRDILFSTKKWQVLSFDDTKWLFHVIQYKNVYLGAGIQLDTIEKKFEEALIYEDASVSFKNEDIVISTSNVEKMTQPSLSGQFYLHVQIPQSSIVKNLPILQRMGYWMAILELLLIPVLIVFLSYYVIKPLNILTMAIEQLRKNPDARVTAKADSSEFALVYDSFNDMAGKIVQMRIDNYEQKMEQQRISMKNLQLQVKPHFLFNSFNLMYNLVEMGEYKSAQKMILYLSDYFHYINIGKDDFSRFGDEYNLIKMYLEVSQIRYPDFFEVLYDVSEEIKEVCVPQLLVHNFVENFIKHGIDLNRKNHILIQAYVSKGEAVFRVEDDGRGMAAEEVLAINNGKFNYPDGKNHLGVKNSFDRIHFFYGDKGNIYFESEVDKGTIVAITLPLEPE